MEVRSFTKQESILLLSVLDEEGNKVQEPELAFWDNIWIEQTRANIVAHIHRLEMQEFEIQNTGRERRKAVKIARENKL